MSLSRANFHVAPAPHAPCGRGQAVARGRIAGQPLQQFSQQVLAVRGPGVSFYSLHGVGWIHVRQKNTFANFSLIRNLRALASEVQLRPYHAQLQKKQPALAGSCYFV